VALAPVSGLDVTPVSLRSGRRPARRSGPDALKAGRTQEAERKRRNEIGASWPFVSNHQVNIAIHIL
jgi:hypothetical protein